MHYYKRNIGDYYKKAGRLSMLQHGAYTLLIDACYDREKFPTLEQAIEWAWASTEEEIQAVKFVLSKFFSEVDGVFIQQHIADDLSAYIEKAEKNRLIALEREAKRREKRTTKHETCTDGSRSDHESPPNHKPITNNQEPLTINQEPEDKPKDLLPSKLDDSVKRVIDLLNSLTGSKYRASTKSHSANISGRLNEGHSVDDLLDVVRFKCGEWLHDPKMAQYLRPETLFQAGKFNGYLAATRCKPVKRKAQPTHDVSGITYEDCDL